MKAKSLFWVGETKDLMMQIWQIAKDNTEQHEYI